jgi:hypothetical protein
LLLENLHTKRNIRADVLGQDTIREEYKKNPNVHEVYSYGEGFFSEEAFPDSLLHSLRNKRYDTVLVPMANRHLPGYRNVIDVARQLKPKDVLGIFSDGSLQPLC